jgi:hypothetical protein
VLPLADLAGLPEQRLLAVQSADSAAARVTLSYLSFEGHELDRTQATLAGEAARTLRLADASADAASVLVRSEGAPVLAAVLQQP